MQDRDSLRTAGRALRERLGIPAELHAEAVSGYRDLFDELVFGSLWQRPGLDLASRLVATLACLAALERHRLVGAYAGAAQTMGLDADAVREVVLQAGLYIGFAAVEPSLEAVNAVLGEPVSADDDGRSTADLDAEGTAIMAALHGERAAGGYADPQAGAPAALYRLAIRYGYGVLWARGALSRRHRFVVSVSVFAALEQPTQLAKFARSAFDHGLDFEAASEVLMQIAPYAGFPRALNALTALEALSDEQQ